MDEPIYLPGRTHFSRSVRLIPSIDFISSGVAVFLYCYVGTNLINQPNSNLGYNDDLRVLSCAERGVRNAFVARRDEMSQRGVIVPSGGNMAMGAAYHGSALGIPVKYHYLPPRRRVYLGQGHLLLLRVRFANPEFHKNRSSLDECVNKHYLYK